LPRKHIAQQTKSSRLIATKSTTPRARLRAKRETTMITQRKTKPEWFHYALATGVSLLVALMIAGLGTVVGH
jgi:hypothetical protein